LQHAKAAKKEYGDGDVVVMGCKQVLLSGERAWTKLALYKLNINVTYVLALYEWVGGITKNRLGGIYQNITSYVDANHDDGCSVVTVTPRRVCT